MKSFSKKDIIFILLLALCIILIYFAVNVLLKKDADYVELSVNGEVIDTYPLNEDKIVKIFEKDIINNFEIKEGAARMIKADCPDGTCMRQGSINKHNETIVCLPHRVVIRGVSIRETKDSIDTVVK